jgi:hypothetical protein
MKICRSNQPTHILLLYSMRHTWSTQYNKKKDEAQIMPRFVFSSELKTISVSTKNSWYVKYASKLKPAIKVCGVWAHSTNAPVSSAIYNKPAAHNGSK